MLDIQYIRDNASEVKRAVTRKSLDCDIDTLLLLDAKKNTLQKELDDIRAQKNELNTKMKGKKPTDEQLEEGKNIKQETQAIEAKFKEVEDQFFVLMYQVPNVISEDTPEGKDEEENLVLRTFGEKPEFDFTPKNHMDVCGKNIDTQKAAQISGSRFNYLFGDVALLQFALIDFVMQTLTDTKIISTLAKKVGSGSEKPFIPAITPVMCRDEVMKKMDRFDPIDDRYYFEKDNILLVGSAEHTLGPLHMDEIIKEEDLPIRYIGYSTSFRREAGTYGKDTSGILRRHQFDKLEMECFTTPEQGLVEQELLVAIQEYLVQQLGIHHQVVLKCTGDMGGKADFRAIDIECWIPSQNTFRETHTADYMTDFQARRLNTRYVRTGTKEKNFVHMNDATAFGIGRILIAIIENFQQKDGSIVIPKVLQPYMRKEKMV
ncbi:MAG: serine--tRNA ligase [Candidatus Magasanikbacteria bacterium]|jgi:seryl-tRNA synthetase|nr:serine--tRNA ligase [Candidatus Magasanikbacteria bacterium]MBT5262888.1 serine--tRNA ligase [Candidatus Magasanikbacteria bacterium]MBT5820031.1 serine--tRNA ligase [Candidatus Magasanikbacteria bacterium]MBT6294687.1 serine--tRNA ligase [Candidatus Magasanikbacteria bacterium]